MRRAILLSLAALVAIAILGTLELLDPTRSSARLPDSTIAPPTSARAESPPAVAPAASRQIDPRATEAPDGLTRAEAKHLPSPATIVGRVVDFDGTPLRSARLRLRAEGVDLDVACDERAHFTLVLPDAHPRSRALLSIHAADHVDRELRLNETDPDTTYRLGDLSLLRCARLRARLRRDDGGSVAAAEVFLGSTLAARVAVGTADALGSVDLRIDRFGAFDVEFTVAGLATSLPRAVMSLPGGVIDLGEVLLAPLIRLRGIVVDHGGAPIPRAEVLAVEDPNTPEFGTRTTTGEDGRFELLVSQAPPISLLTDADGYRTSVLREVAGPELRIALELAPVLRGRILDAASGLPVERAEIRSALRRVLSDPSGSFALPLWPPSDTGLLIRALGYCESRITQTARPPTELSIRLDRASRLTGRILDRNGAPVADADLWSTQESRPTDAPPWWSSSPSPRARSGSDGRFAIEPIEPGKQVVRARARQGFASTAIEIPRGTGAELELVLLALPTITGRVLGDSVHAVAVLIARDIGTRVENVTEGHFRFRDVEPGSYVLRAFADMATAQCALRATDDPAWEDPGSVLVVRDRDIDGLTLAIFDAGIGTIVGQARLGSLPAAGCRVRVQRSDDDAGRERIGGTVAGDGRFRIDGVRVGEVRVDLLAPSPPSPVVYGTVLEEIALASQRVLVTETDIDVDLRADCATLSIRGAGPRDILELRDEHGHVAVAHPTLARRGILVPVGRLHLSLRDGDEVIEREVTIAAGSRETVDFSDR